MRARLTTIAVVAALVAAAFLLGALRPGSDRHGRRTAPPRHRRRRRRRRRGLGPAPNVGALDATIAALEERLDRVPDDWRTSAALGIAYVQRARITSDPPGTRPPSGGARAVARAPSGGQRGRACGPQDAGCRALRLRRGESTGRPHRAVRRRRLRRARRRQLELGRYGAAFRTFQRMVDTRPDLASYARSATPWSSGGAWTPRSRRCAPRSRWPRVPWTQRGRLPTSPRCTSARAGSGSPRGGSVEPVPRIPVRSRLRRPGARRVGLGDLDAAIAGYRQVAMRTHAGESTSRCWAICTRPRATPAARGLPPSCGGGEAVPGPAAASIRARAVRGGPPRGGLGRRSRPPAPSGDDAPASTSPTRTPGRSTPTAGTCRAAGWQPGAPPGDAQRRLPVPRRHDRAAVGPRGRGQGAPAAGLRHEPVLLVRWSPVLRDTLSRLRDA